MDFLLRHGLTFGDLPVETHASLPETWNLVLVGPYGEVNAYPVEVLTEWLESLSRYAEVISQCKTSELRA